ncbi:MAG: hypothetical protein ACYDHY_07560 [Acidiferrobacterales bacterium]
MPTYQTVAPTAVNTHEAEISQYQVQATVLYTLLTANQQTVQNICDCLQVPPPDTQTSTAANALSYANICIAAASAVGNPIPSTVFENAQAAVQSKLSIGNQTTSTNLTTMADQNVAQLARNNVLTQVNAIEAFISQANAAGFRTPANPFNAIAQLNSTRGLTFTPLAIPSATADQIITDIGTLLGLLAKQASGQVQFSDQTPLAAQLSSFEISLAGFGGSGNPQTDLAQFLPSLDSIQNAQAQAALSVLDFTKRLPQMLFTIDYAPDGPIKGSIVCWKVISDATGYVLKRHSIFENTDVSFTLTNDDLNASYPNIEDYVNTWGLKFYDNINENQVYAYLDATVDPNQYYLYTITAYQIQKTLQGSVFERPAGTVQAHFSNTVTATPGSSPYPALAQIVLGDSSYDWILAGLNIQASIDRKDPTTTTRKYSYINADLSFLVQQMTSNLFVQPKPGDLNQLVQDITNGISTYGLSQTIQELLNGTGIFYYFEGLDPTDSAYFSNVTSTDPSQSNLMAGIVAAIDPSTAVCDLQALTTNLNNVINGVSSSPTGFSPITQAQPQEIDVPPGGGQSSETPNLETLGSTSTTADLTTYDGLSLFIRTIRVVANASPNRGTPMATFGVPSSGSLITDPSLLTQGKTSSSSSKKQTSSSGQNNTAGQSSNSSSSTSAPSNSSTPNQPKLWRNDWWA